MKTKLLTVAEFADVYSGGTPSTKNSNYWDGGIPWITPKDMSAHSGMYIDQGARSITEQGLHESAASLLPVNTIILSSRAPVGYVAIAKKPLSTNQGCKNLQCKEEVAFPKFIYYLLRNSTKKLRAHATGSTYTELSTNRLKNISFCLPENVKVQEKIASVLSGYDDLIENNRQQIQLLEQAAQLLYKKWFVHLRFPGHEHATITNRVPKGWEKKTLGDIVQIKKGKNITKNLIKDGFVPVVAGGLAPAYYHDTANVTRPIITVSASGANAGYVNLYHEDIWASDCSYISQTSTNYPYYFYLLLVSKQKEIFRLQRGAAQPHVYPRDLQRLTLHSPTESIIRVFEESVSHNFRQARNLIEQNKLLSKARDLLLPRLINGRVSIQKVYGEDSQ